MKIVRLASSFTDLHRLSSPKPRLRHGRRLALISCPNLTLNLCILLHSVAGSYSSSPNFPNFSSPRKSASVFANYLRSHFSVPQPKALHSRARGYLFDPRQATCPEESYSPFCSLFSPAEYLLAAFNLSSSTAPGSPDLSRQSCLSHAKASLSLWHGFSSHFQSFLVSASLFFHLENIYYSRP